MKKILVLVLALTLIATMMTLVACGGDKPKATTATTTAATTPAATTTATATTTAAIPGATDPVTTTAATPGVTDPVTTTTAATPGVTDPVTTTTAGTPGVTDPVTTTTAGTPDDVTTPATTTADKPDVTTPATTQQPSNPGTPAMRDPGKDYHIESATYKTSSKGEDEEFLIISDAGVNMNERYADGGGMILYEIGLEGMIEPTIELVVRQQYAVYFTNDLEIVDYEDMFCAGNFNDTADEIMSENPDAFNEQGAYTAGTNITTLTINPFENGIYDVVYIYIVNARPEFGWGGTIMSLTINQYVEGKGPEVTTIDNSAGEPHYKPADAEEVVEEMLVNGNDEDEAYIHLNTSNANETRRYTDGTAFLVYRVNLRNMYEPTVELYVTQNYKIEVSADGEDWYEIANFGLTDQYNELKAANPDAFNPSGDYLEGDNWTTIVIDPYNPGEGIDPMYGNLYIRLSDCFPSAGWGCAIEKLTIKHYGFVNQ